MQQDSESKINTTSWQKLEEYQVSMGFLPLLPLEVTTSTELFLNYFVII